MSGVEIASMQSDEACESSQQPLHVPVLGAEIVAIFRGLDRAQASGWIVDATVGAGGHSELLLEALPDVRVLGVDQDPAAVELAERRLYGRGRFAARARVCRGRLSQLARVIRDERAEPVIGMLFDLGVSSVQLAAAERGFSFQHDGPLDMRMDPSRDRTAADIVNHWDERDLADLLFYEGGESRARSVARAIVAGRRRAPFLRTSALADAITQAVGRAPGASKIHPATRSFQALRRAVNEEGEELQAGLAAADLCVAAGGRLAVISFHSGEDREVKRFFASRVRDGRWRAITPKPLEASAEERRANPRSRSARLRAGERLRRNGEGASLASRERAETSREDTGAERKGARKQ
jgi:16S rRNA (cytosine1402-N4)-methyltransferase